MVAVPGVEAGADDLEFNASWLCNLFYHREGQESGESVETPARRWLSGFDPVARSVREGVCAAMKAFLVILGKEAAKQLKAFATKPAFTPVLFGMLQNKPLEYFTPEVLAPFSASFEKDEFNVDNDSVWVSQVLEKFNGPLTLHGESNGDGDLMCNIEGVDYKLTNDKLLTFLRTGMCLHRLIRMKVASATAKLGSDAGDAAAAPPDVFQDGIIDKYVNAAMAGKALETSQKAFKEAVAAAGAGAGNSPLAIALISEVDSKRKEQTELITKALQDGIRKSFHDSLHDKDVFNDGETWSAGVMLVEKAEKIEDVQEEALKVTQHKAMKRLFRKKDKYAKMTTKTSKILESELRGFSWSTVAQLPAITSLVADVKLVCACNVAIQALFSEPGEQSSRKSLVEFARKEIRDFGFTEAELPPKIVMLLKQNA